MNKNTEMLKSPQSGNPNAEQSGLAGQQRFNWMPVLRTGTFTDKNNQTVVIDQSALDKIVSATDLTSEPQIVVEHPKFDEVGFGTIVQLKRAGNFLFALPGKVLEKFKKAVNDGKLPGRSVTLDKNTFTLKNVSFLPPDMPPAVTGLGAYSFQEMDDGKCLMVDVLPGVESHFADIETGNFEFAQYEVSGSPLKNIQTIFRNLKNFLNGEKSPEIAEEILPEIYLNEVAASTPAPEEKQISGMDTSLSSNQEEIMLNENESSNSEKVDLTTIDLSEADPQLKDAIESLQAENMELSADLKNKNIELQIANEKISAAQKEKLHRNVILFCETDAKKKIKPTDKEKFINYLLLQADKGLIEFSVPDTSGGGSEMVQLNAYDFAKEIIMRLPDFISDIEMATFDNSGITGLESAELLAQKALKYQASEGKAGRNISASAAVAYVKSKMK
jgi:flagellin-specific chaperone FliS